jgi:hypothetical protein
MPGLYLSASFRDECRDRIAGVFVACRLRPPDFRRWGDREVRLLARFEHAGRIHEIEISEDDIVMTQGKQLFECYLREEHRNPESLIQAFTYRLGRYLSGGDWARPTEPGLRAWVCGGFRRLVRGWREGHRPRPGDGSRGTHG